MIVQKKGNTAVIYLYGASYMLAILPVGFKR